MCLFIILSFINFRFDSLISIRDNEIGYFLSGPPFHESVLNRFINIANSIRVQLFSAFSSLSSDARPVLRPYAWEKMTQEACQVFLKCEN